MTSTPIRTVLAAAVLAALVPGGELYAAVELTSAWAGQSRSLDQRTKTKKLSPFDLIVAAEREFPAGPRSMVCSARVFDKGTDRNGLPRRSKGVKVEFKGELLDAATGETLQVLSKRSDKTDKNGDAFLEFPIAGVDNFIAVMTGKMKKKRATGMNVACEAAPEETEAGRAMPAKSRGLRLQALLEAGGSGGTGSVQAGSSSRIEIDDGLPDPVPAGSAVLWLGGSFVPDFGKASTQASCTLSLWDFLDTTPIPDIGAEAQATVTDSEGAVAGQAALMGSTDSSGRIVLLLRELAFSEAFPAEYGMEWLWSMRKPEVLQELRELGVEVTGSRVRCFVPGDFKS